MATLVLGSVVLLAPNAQVQEVPTIRTDVNLVQVQARVTDAQGRAVSGLARDAFSLLVDEQPQEITLFQKEDATVSAGIVIDNSASMAPKRDEVLAAAMAFARTSNPRDEMFVVHFNERTRFGLPEGVHFAPGNEGLQAAISAFQIEGTTALYDGLARAEDNFIYASNVRKAVLLVTDGGDNSSQSTLHDVLENALRQGIVIYAIGIFDPSDRDNNPKALTELATATGGAAFFPSQLSDVNRICVEIAREIRSQYTIGFAGANDGRHHQIQVLAQDKKYGPLTVHTRSVYVAAEGRK